MNIIFMREVVGSATAAVLLITLAGCSSSTSSAPAVEGTSSGAEASQAPAPAKAAPDLTGDWVQSNSKSADSYQAATITADTIAINWISDGGDTTSVYWAGSYVAPTSDGTYTWDLVNDTTKTSHALLASSDPTKTFNYDDGTISYKVSLAGTTATVKLAKK